ncbi:MAG: hypothetical protein R3E31_28540 [Chloroflexota bacterium]
MPHTRPIFTPPVVLRWGFILLGITAVSLILIIASGQLDPQPIGTATASLTPGVQPIPTQSKTAQWLTLPDPGHVFTVRGTAVFTETADIRGGLRLGTSAQAFDVLISPLATPPSAPARTNFSLTSHGRMCVPTRTKFGLMYRNR